MHSNSPSSSPSLIRIAFPVIVSLTVALPSPIAKISHDLWSESKSGLPDPLTRLARTEGSLLLLLLLRFFLRGG